MVFMRGDTPLTSRLLKPVLIDARDRRSHRQPRLPWYVTALLVSQPLHFGDYGGMPLKIIWALLDLVTIVVLVQRALSVARAAPLTGRGAHRRARRAGVLTMMRVWKWPIVLSALTIFGLLAALLGQDEAWWIASWIALGVPLLVIARALAR